MNVAVYVRVSTQEQKLHGISVDAQEAFCREWVSEQGHKLVGVYNDAGLSARAKYTKRPAMLNLIRDIRAGEVELIVFTKLDRWFRNVADYYEVQAVLEEHHVKWRALQEDYETETASGRFKVNIMLAVAQDEADRTSERIKVAADYKRQKGEAVGRAPMGYKIENKHFVIDPVKEPAIRAFFETYLETYSAAKARRAAQDHGVTINVTKAGRILRSESYCGNHYGVPCPAYITVEEHERIGRVVDSHTREPRLHLTYLFTGLLRCGYCGGALTSAAPRHKDGIRRLKTYRCCYHMQYFDRCPTGSYVNEAKLEAYLVDNLSVMLEAYRAELETWEERHKNNAAELRRLEGKLSRLKDLYIDGEIDRDTYNRRSDTIKAEVEVLRSEAGEKPTLPDACDLPENWRDTYWDLSDAGKKQFWHSVIRQIIIYKDRPPEVRF